jgi:hypothetical protein
MGRSFEQWSEVFPAHVMRRVRYLELVREDLVHHFTSRALPLTELDRTLAALASDVEHHPDGWVLLAPRAGALDMKTPAAADLVLDVLRWVADQPADQLRLRQLASAAAHALSGVADRFTARRARQLLDEERFASRIPLAADALRRAEVALDSAARGRACRCDEPDPRYRDPDREAGFKRGPGRVVEAGGYDRVTAIDVTCDACGARWEIHARSDPDRTSWTWSRR